MNGWLARIKTKTLLRMLESGIVVTGLLLTPLAHGSERGHQTKGSAGVQTGIDEKRPCEPVAVYGPPMCDSDEQCVKEQGEGWYCDKDHGYDDGCGGKISWPVCAQKPIQPPSKPEPVDKPEVKDPDPEPDHRDAPCVYGPPPQDD